MLSKYNATRFEITSFESILRNPVVSIVIYLNCDPRPILGPNEGFKVQQKYIFISSYQDHGDLLSLCMPR